MYKNKIGDVLLMHTLIKTVNGHQIRYWSLGDTYYVTDKQGNWLYEHKDLDNVEEWTKNNKKRVC